MERINDKTGFLIYDLRAQLCCLGATHYEKIDPYADPTWLSFFSEAKPGH